MNPPHSPPATPPDYISIPQDLKWQPIERLSRDVAGGARLSWNVHQLLEQAGIQYLGGLDGKRLSDFDEHGTYGAGTIWALRCLIFRALHPGKEPDLTTRPVPMRCWFRAEQTIAVPQAAADLRLEELPVSARLEGILREMGIERLGQLRGITGQRLAVRPNCGPKTLAEINSLLGRAEAGELTFSEGEFASKTPADLLRLIDDLLQAMPERYRAFVMLYLGAAEQGPQTYRQIGEQHGITGSRVGQQLSDAIRWMRREGTGRLRALLASVEGVCARSQAPPSPAMVSAWQDPTRPLRYNPQFYARLIPKLQAEVGATRPTPGAPSPPPANSA